jgi:hypothetical protein
MWPPRRITVVVLAGVTVLVVGLMLAGGGGTNDAIDGSLSSSAPPVATATGEADASTPATAPPDPAVDVAATSAPSAPSAPSVPFEQTADGARAAAVAYLESTETGLTLQPAEAGAWARDSASAAYSDTFAADTEARMVELWETIPEGITLRLAPIETRVVADGDAWLVSVWFVEAITVGTEGVVDDWRTATYRMVWEGGAWKIDRFASERGPMPGRGTSPASETPAGFEALLAGFDDEGLS